MLVYNYTMENLDNLVELIKQAREAYYNLDPIISDDEYDALLDELKKISPNHAELRIVGAAVPRTTAWEKVSHDIPMGSLNKIHTVEEYEAFVEKCGISEWFITYKYDGISLECVYEDGRLIRSVTRGDGIIGENVLQNALAVKSIPQTIQFKERISVRGEFIIAKANFAKYYSSEYANARNTASGLIRDFKASTNGKLENCEYVAYDCTLEHRLMTDRISWLKLNGFKTPDRFRFGSKASISEFFAETADERETLEFDIDGCVVSPYYLKALSDAGHVNLRPEAVVAWKFAASSAVSIVRNIRWTVGATGRVTPVAIIDPTVIGGVTITNVSLQNLGAFKELRLKPGSRVLVSRKNDVIPYLDRNLDLV